ncbi:MAG: histidine phosphatase family protein [Proteobacteria bacterium]|nr:histidine phosphatase family protein [Pseudomonadota bacterium]
MRPRSRSGTTVKPCAARAILRGQSARAPGARVRIRRDLADTRHGQRQGLTDEEVRVCRRDGRRTRFAAPEPTQIRHAEMLAGVRARALKVLRVVLRQRAGQIILVGHRADGAAGAARARPDRRGGGRLARRAARRWRPRTVAAAAASRSRRPGMRVPAACLSRRGRPGAPPDRRAVRARCRPARCGRSR